MSAVPVLKALGLIEAVFLRYSQFQGAAYSETARLLEHLGRVEYQAAIKALKDAEKSKNPRRELESAITCLRLAVQKYEAAAASKGILAEAWSTAVKDVISPAHWAGAEAALEIAAIYKHLGEGALAETYATKAAVAFNNYACAMGSFNRVRSALPRSTGGEDRGIHPETARQLEQEKRKTKSILDRVGYGGDLLEAIEKPQ